MEVSSRLIPRSERAITLDVWPGGGDGRWIVFTRARVAQRILKPSAIETLAQLRYPAYGLHGPAIAFARRAGRLHQTAERIRNIHAQNHDVEIGRWGSRRLPIACGAEKFLYSLGLLL